MADELNMLTDDELARMAQEGSSTAEEYLLRKYMPLARGRARAYFIAGADSDDVIQDLREKLNTSWYEDLLRKLLLEEGDLHQLTLVPDPALGDKTRRAEEERLGKVMAAMTEEEKDSLIEENGRLLSWQQTPSETILIPLTEKKARTLVLAWQEGKRLSPQEKAFCQFAEKWFQENILFV